MSRFGFLIIVFFIVVAVFAPFSVSAAAVPEFSGPIVPCGAGGALECQACHLMTLAQNVINFIIFLATVAAVLMFVYAGFLYITAVGDTGKIKQAHGIFRAVVIGFVIVLASWLFVDTLMKAFLNDQAFGPWEKILCETPTQTTPSTPSGSPPITAGGTAPSVQTGTLTHEEAAAQLSAAGVSITATGNCTDRNISTCTSLDGIRQSTLDEVIRLKQACGCNIVVNGGTEVGHTPGTFSHSTGWKIDIDDNPSTNNYILSNCLELGTRSDGATIFDCGTFNGINPVYARESDHWDILVPGVQ